MKGGENSKPGREGVFEFPLDYANRTPAGAFFGLGDEDAERAKRAGFYERAAAAARGNARPVPEPWCPDFGAAEEAVAGEAAAPESKRAETVIDDEWAAWDE